MSCPSQLRLDEWVADPRSPSVAEHLPTCARCQARVERLVSERATFLARARPAAFVDAVLSRRAARRWLTPLVLAAATAAVLLLVRLVPSGPTLEQGEESYKGGEPDARLYVRHEGVLTRYEPTRPLVAGDLLQVVVVSTRPVWVSVVDLEDGGTERVLFASEHALPAGRSPLPSAFELDAWAGGERLVVLFGAERISDAIERARRGEGRSFVVAR